MSRFSALSLCSLVCWQRKWAARQKVLLTSFQAMITSSKVPHYLNRLIILDFLFCFHYLLHSCAPKLLEQLFLSLSSASLSLLHSRSLYSLPLFCCHSQNLFAIFSINRDDLVFMLFWSSSPASFIFLIIYSSLKSLYSLMISFPVPLSNITMHFLLSSLKYSIHCLPFRLKRSSHATAHTQTQVFNSINQFDSQ